MALLLIFDFYNVHITMQHTVLLCPNYNCQLLLLPISQSLIIEHIFQVSLLPRFESIYTKIQSLVILLYKLLKVYARVTIYVKK